MYKVRLVNIKCHEDSTYYFTSSNLSLIKGPSGIGKSTIFEGITWCLFGKIKGIKNKRGSNVKSNVEITCSDYSIFRQGKYLSFKVNDGGGCNLYEGDIAQNMIYTHFGSEELWYSCSYIKQKELCPLLYGTNNDRMNLLNNLSFWLNKPEECIDKFDSAIKICEAEFNLLQKCYFKDCENFTTQQMTNPINENLIATIKGKYNIILEDHEILKCLNELLLSLNKEHTILSSELSEEIRLKGTLDSLNIRLFQLRASINNIKGNVGDAICIKAGIQICNKDCEDLHKEVVCLEKNKESMEHEKNIITLKISNELKDTASLKQERQTLIKDIEITNQTKLNYEAVLIKLQSFIRDGRLTDNMIDTYGKYTSQNLSNFKELFENIKINENKCKQLSISYDPTVISNYRKEYSEQLERISIIIQDDTIRKSIQELNAAVESLGAFKHITDEHHASIYNKFKDITNYNSRITCPSCNVSLKYVSGKIYLEDKHVLSEKDVSVITDEYHTVKSDYEKTKLYCTYKSKIEYLNKMLKNPEGSLPSDEDIEKIKNVLRILNSITFYNGVEGVDINDLATVLEFKNIANGTGFDIKKIKDIELLESAVKTFDDMVQDKRSVVREIDLKLSDLKDNGLARLNEEHLAAISKINDNIRNESLRMTNLKAKIERLSRQLYEIETSEKSMIECENSIKDINERLNPKVETAFAGIVQKIKDIHTLNVLLENKKNIMEKHNNLLSKHKEILLKQKKLTNLYEMRKIAYDLQCEELQSTVNIVNSNLNNILRDIFEKPIRATLRLYKKNKTNDKLISSVNFSILYDDIEYDGVNNLSGGEKDRLSFALMVALSSVNGSPFLILDETMSSLDSTYRELCINCLRSPMMKNKTILCVNHEDVEGLYDNVINIS